MGKDDIVIKFSTAKKAVKRSRKEKMAAENRVKFGRTKAEKMRDAKIKGTSAAYLDGHKREPD